MDKLRELIYLSIGRASMCWSEIPRGTFDDQYAHQIGEELLQAIAAHVKEELAKQKTLFLLEHPLIVRDKDGQEIARTRSLC